MKAAEGMRDKVSITPYALFAKQNKHLTLAVGIFFPQSFIGALLFKKKCFNIFKYNTKILISKNGQSSSLEYSSH